MVLGCQNFTQKIYKPVSTEETMLANSVDDDAFPQRIKVISCAQDNMPGVAVEHQKKQRESGVLAYIKQVLFTRSMEPKESDTVILRQLEKGRILNEQSQYLQQVRPCKGKSAIRFTKKQAITLGGVLLAGAAGGAFYRLWGQSFATDEGSSEIYNASEYAGVYQSEATDLTRQ